MKIKCRFLCRTARKMHLRMLEIFWSARSGYFRPFKKSQGVSRDLVSNTWRVVETFWEKPKKSEDLFGLFPTVSPDGFNSCVKMKNLQKTAGSRHETRRPTRSLRYMSSHKSGFCCPFPYRSAVFFRLIKKWRNTREMLKPSKVLLLITYAPSNRATFSQTQLVR
jgi:hypothetical protein